MDAIDLSRVRFLLVDDNQFMRSLIRTILSALEVKEVMEAGDGADAFKMMRNGMMPDIILLDWNLPTLDGVEFTRLIRTGADSPNPFVPIIMISAYSQRGRVLAARDAGINEFLAKPVSAKSLYTRIEAVISRPRPFVKVSGYFGPDRRRRRDLVGYSGPDRRGQGAPARMDENIDQNAIDDLMGSSVETEFEKQARAREGGSGSGDS